MKIYNIKHLDTCKQVRFIPKSNYIVLEVIYEKQEKELKKDNKRYMSIDLGINNLCTCTNNCKLNSFIIDGKKLKHINQYFNKCKAYLQSKLNQKQYTSNLINKITKKRNLRIKNYLHNVSKYIVNQAVNNQINTIIIGHNKGWKQETNIGNVNNQNFVQIPFNQLVNLIYYKAKLQGINVILQEESYTSKVSFIDNDFIPVYGLNDELCKPSGKRICRGLYKTLNGLKINADVNGSLNIMRKYLKCNSDEIISPTDVGLVVNPVKVYL
ncbi:transposase [bacterium]|nr:transposase [bacterium]